MRYYTLALTALVGLLLSQQAAAQRVSLPPVIPLRGAAIDAWESTSNQRPTWRPSRGSSAQAEQAYYEQETAGVAYAPQPRRPAEVAVFLDEPEPLVRPVVYQATPQGLDPTFNRTVDYQQHESASIWAPTDPDCPPGQGMEQVVDFPGIGARVGGGYRYGEDVGLDDNLAWFQGFAPVYQRPGRDIVFVEFRGINYDSSNHYGANGEAGYRFYSPSSDRVYGFYGGYDYRRYDPYNFGQVSAGLESLGQMLDARANGYVVVSETEQIIGVSDPYFIGNNIQFDTTRVRAMSGFDAELGVNLTPSAENVAIRAFAGGYGFFDGNGNDAWGPRGRIEGTFFNSIIAEGSAQNDDIFGTTWYVSLSVLLGARPKPGTNSCNGSTVVNRLGDPLKKNMHVVLQQRQQSTLAINPTTNDPFLVLHADSSAAAGGDGTFENPYNTLTATEANNNANYDIVLLHAGSQFNNEGITLPFAQQRLLGDGLSTPHLFTSQFGTLNLPRANALAASPQIINAPVDAVAIAANQVEVSGLNIQNATQVGISGTNLTGFDINRNIINNSLAGISLEGTNQGVIAENVATNTLAGIHVATFTSGSIRDNVANNNSVGFVLESMTGGTVQDNSASNNAFAGFQFNDVSGGTIQNNLSANTTLNGFVFTNVSGGNILSNTATNNGADGFNFAAVSGGNIQGNNATDNGDDGFEFTAVSGGTIQANTSADNASNGFLFTTVTDGTIQANTATNNGSSGFYIDTLDNGNVLNNIATSNAVDGFTIFNFNGGTVANNTSTLNLSDGFELGSNTDGANVGGWSGGALNNNASNNNLLGFGYRVTNRTGGTASGNTASGNADNTTPAP